MPGCEWEGRVPRVGASLSMFVPPPPHVPLACQSRWRHSARREIHPLSFAPLVYICKGVHGLHHTPDRCGLSAGPALVRGRHVFARGAPPIPSCRRRSFCAAIVGTRSPRATTRRRSVCSPRGLRARDGMVSHHRRATHTGLAVDFILDGATADPLLHGRAPPPVRDRCVQAPSPAQEAPPIAGRVPRLPTHSREVAPLRFRGDPPPRLERILLTHKWIRRSLSHAHGLLPQRPRSHHVACAPQIDQSISGDLLRSLARAPRRGVRRMKDSLDEDAWGRAREGGRPWGGRDARARACSVGGESLPRRTRGVRPPSPLPGGVRPGLVTRARPDRG